MVSDRVVHGTPEKVDVSTDVLVIGAGASGLVAALRAKAAGSDVLVLERDASPSGSVSMSSGFVPAPATKYQRMAGVDDDTPERFQADIMAKSKGTSVLHLASLASRTIAPALEWLGDEHGFEWAVLDDFLYPGHSRHRMHALPAKTGAALHGQLLRAADTTGIPIVTEARATRLFVGSAGQIEAVEVLRPDGAKEIVSCGALVLACSGYGGSPDLVREHIPEMAGGLYYGHAGNTGDALAWGKALDARLEHLSGYQGHGSLAHPHSILISWALMTRGAIQVNAEGTRFSDESGGYSEQAVHVLGQPGGVAWNIYDNSIHDFALGFPDYREAVEVGAIRKAETLAGLASCTGLPLSGLQETFKGMAECRSGKAADLFGRDFAALPEFEPPFFAVKVTGALFHTQGGLLIDEDAHVLGNDGTRFRNLFAAGGAACGVSGPDVSGYLSGNGLLTAIAFGFVAGRTAASKPGCGSNESSMRYQMLPGT